MVDAHINDDIRIHVDGAILTVAAEAVVEAVRILSTNGDAMSDIAFAKLVSEMRNAQKEYCRTQSNSALDELQRLETKVDRCCAHILDGQKRLFPED